MKGWPTWRWDIGIIWKQKLPHIHPIANFGGVFSLHQSIIHVYRNPILNQSLRLVGSLARWAWCAQVLH
jgi:hypothetical protein